MLSTTNLAEIEEVAHTIRQELSAQYMIGYVPTNQTRDHAERQIKIEIADVPGREKRIVHARTSYVALCR